MAEGPGKYDKLCTWVRERAKARGVILIVLDGEHGSGHSAQIHASSIVESMLEHVDMLRAMADDIERDAKARLT